MMNKSVAIRATYGELLQADMVSPFSQQSSGNGQRQTKIVGAFTSNTRSLSVRFDRLMGEIKRVLKKRIGKYGTQSMLDLREWSSWWRVS
jgi:hypothetical protein